MQLSLGEWDAVLQTAKVLKVAYEPTEGSAQEDRSQEQPAQQDHTKGHRLAHAVVIAARLIMHEVQAGLERARDSHGLNAPPDTMVEIEGLHVEDLTGLMALFLENAEDISRRVSTEDVLGAGSGGEYRAAHLRNEIVMRSLEHLQHELAKILKRLGQAVPGAVG